VSPFRTPLSHRVRTILPSGRKGRGFDPATVRIDHKHSLGGPPADAIAA